MSPLGIEVVEVVQHLVVVQTPFFNHLNGEYYSTPFLDFMF